MKKKKRIRELEDKVDRLEQSLERVEGAPFRFIFWPYPAPYYSQPWWGITPPPWRVIPSDRTSDVGYVLPPSTSGAFTLRPNATTTAFEPATTGHDNVVRTDPDGLAVRSDPDELKFTQ